MNKTYKIAFGLFLLLIVSLAWLESKEPEPVNWNPSYTSKDKIPLGAFVFYNSWDNYLENEIAEIRIPPYEYLNDNPENGNYFFLNNYVNFDDDELDDLLNWVSKGNKLFISAYNFGENLEDTLDFKIGSFISSEAFTSRPQLNLVNPGLQLPRDVLFDQDLPALYFKDIDSTSHTVLGTVFFEGNSGKKINFIKTEFGEGEILLHTTPQAFSNYFLLKEENYKYVENLLAYLDGENILWDAYYKSGRSYFSSPLYILLNNRPLKWAYYFVIITTILFIFFEGKRKQRAIPVVEPLKNRSFEYSATLSHLYLEKRNFYELRIRKITLFMEFIRQNYRLDTNSIEEEFYRNLASKSNNSLETTKGLFQRIFKFQNETENTKEAFLELSNSINSFKNNGSKGRK